MKLRQITIRNFKAIPDTTLDLADFTVIIGANGSGKSSVLQALHWMLQCATHRTVRPQRQGGETISERAAPYMPTLDYRNAGHGQTYGSYVGSPQLDLFARGDFDGAIHEADMWIKSGRNEGIKVHIPAQNEFVRALRSLDRQITAYIPGLAGIPLQEEKLARFDINRQAAAGDANVVLRNILLRLKEADEGRGLRHLEELVGAVLGPISLRVDFDENSSGTITAEFQTEDMRQADARRFKPLELAGIGFLQVIQIFTYLVHFRPALLLVDEPDAHLHPSTQECLIRALSNTAGAFDTQVVLTTHSPSVVRALPPEARVVWMRDGNVQPEGDTTGRQMMGWGLLDKRVLILSEDTDISPLRLLLSQWPEIERSVAVWPLHGAQNLVSPDGCKSLRALFGDALQIVLHRDRDFMSIEEAGFFCERYREKDVVVWLTRHSDVEGYWLDRDCVASHFEVQSNQAQVFLERAIEALTENDNHLQDFRRKRQALMNATPFRNNADRFRQLGEQELLAQYTLDGPQHAVLGKALRDRLRDPAISDHNARASSFGDSIPIGLAQGLAPDLRDLLVRVMGNR